MTDCLLLLILVIASTMIWPLNRNAMRRGGKPEMLGMWTSGIGLGAGLILALAQRQALFDRAGTPLGVVMGLAFAIGYCLIIFHCLKIGPVGPTVTVNNLGLLGPVATAMLFFNDHKPPSALQMLGVLAVVTALVLVGLNRSDDDTGSSAAAVSGRWVKWVLMGWLFSAISMTAQYLSSQYAPQAPFAFILSACAVSMAVLVAVALWRHSWRPLREEVIAGAFNGLVMALLMPVSLYLLTRMSAAVVFPVTVAAPVVLMLLISNFVLREKLNAAGWSACAVGVLGILLLSVSSSGG